MVLDLLYSLVSEPVLWLPLNEFVHEVSRLRAPVVGNLVLLDFRLSRQYLVSDLLPRLPRVWPLNISTTYLPQHKLIRNNTQCKVVRDKTMVLSAYYFRC